MSLNIPLRSIRLTGREATKLENTAGTTGEIFYDTTNNSLRVFDGVTKGGHLLSQGLTLEETQDLIAAMFTSGVTHSGVTTQYIDSSGKVRITGFSGSYNDLTDKPALFDGSYNSLTNKPNIPAGQVQVDWDATSGVSAILNKPTLFSGSYNDLTDLPTIPGEVNLTGYATETYVNTQINNLVGTAGTALNTLGELSDALGDDANYAATITTALSNKEPTITAGTTSQYWRGDKSWQTLNATAVGLGNVTNESKSTMFSNPTFTNLVQVNGEVSINNNDIGILALGPHGIKFENTADVPNMKFGFVVKGFGGSTLLNYHPDTNFQFNSDVNFVKVGLSQTPVVQITGGGVSTNPGLIVNGTTVLQQTTEVMNTKSGATGTVTHDFLTGGIWYHNTISANFTANFTNVPTTSNRAIVCTLILSQANPAYIPNAVQIDGSPQTIKWLGGSAPSGNASKVDIVSFTLIRVLAGWTVLGSLSTYG